MAVVHCDSASESASAAILSGVLSTPRCCSQHSLNLACLWQPSSWAHLRLCEERELACQEHTAAAEQLQQHANKECKVRHRWYGEPQPSWHAIHQQQHQPGRLHLCKATASGTACWMLQSFLAASSDRPALDQHDSVLDTIGMIMQYCIDMVCWPLFDATALRL